MEKPSIFTFGRQLSELTYVAMDALLRQNDPPRLFWRHGPRWPVIVQVRTTETGAAIISPVTGSYLRLRLSEVADFFSGRPERPTPCIPPSNLSRVLLQLKPEELPLPIIRGVAQRRAGSTDTLGYDRETQMFLYALKEGGENDG